MKLPIKYYSKAGLSNGTMLFAMTGWMDGGMVSTGTVEQLMEPRALTSVATIDADPFVIYNFPGSMEIAALFRPEVMMRGGMTVSLDMPENHVKIDSQANLAFFLGREPNLRWPTFAACVFDLCKVIGISRIIFIGSFGGTVPHTREPRMYASISNESLKPLVLEQGLRLSDYEGPAGFSSLLLEQCPAHSIDMISLVAEIPGYLQGRNPLSIEAVTRCVARMINVPVNVDELRRASNEWEQEVTKAVQKDEELTSTVHKLEQRYDNELIDPDGAK